MDGSRSTVRGEEAPHEDAGMGRALLALLARGRMRESGEVGVQVDGERVEEEVLRRCVELGLVRETEGGRLVLSDEGKAVVRRIGASEVKAVYEKGRQEEAREVPHYDASARTLVWQGVVVKRFKRKAKMQEIVLKAFAEAEWREPISDPLPVEGDVEAKERLRETVKSLNKGLQKGTIRFQADGAGGVRWAEVRKNRKKR